MYLFRVIQKGVLEVMQPDRKTCLAGITKWPNLPIELLNNKLHGLSPPGGLVSPFGGFASLLFDQVVPYYSQRHLANRNAICILHRSDCPLSQCLCTLHAGTERCKLSMKI
jgi:hypothetical protein